MVSKHRVVVICAAAAGMLATFLPWVSLGGLGSQAGTAGDGWITLVLFALALLFAVLGTRPQPPHIGLRVGMVLVAWLAALVGLHDLTGLKDVSWNIVGPGLYLVVLAAAVVIVTACVGHGISPMIIAGVVTVLVVVAGCIHIVYGQQMSAKMKLCTKSSWSIDNTFVNVDDYVGARRDFTNAKVFDTLVDCEVLRRIEVPDEPTPRRRVETFGSCQVDGQLGNCMRIVDCAGTHYAGYCMGADDIQCCIR